MVDKQEDPTFLQYTTTLDHTQQQIEADTYQFTVIAVNQIGDSGYSPPLSVVVP